MAREAARVLLENAGVCRDRTNDCLLVVGELVGNVIQHGCSAAGRFQVAVECRRDDVLLTITDAGPGFDPTAVPPVGGARSNGRVGGFGLPLVRTLCRQVEWLPSPTGTTVRAVVSLEPPAEEPLPNFDLDLADFDDWEAEGFPIELPGVRMPNDSLFRN
jgi:anti-sigma regulatory factor (Ser/Thr protein kinase)